MTPLMNALACLLSLASAAFFWRAPLRLFKETLVILAALLVFGLFSFLAGDMTQPQMESYPFRMLALALCFSTTSLPNKRRRYLLLAQVLWLWIEFFGGISLAYRGFEMPWTRVLALSVGAVGGSMLSRIGHEMEFALMAFWIAVWVFF